MSVFDRRRSRPFALAAALALIPAALAAGIYEKGETLTFTGRVVDAAGEPLAGVPVLLETTRTGFRLRSLRRETTTPVHVASRTDATGAFVIEWPWDGYHNRFALVVALGERDAARPDVLEVFARHDVTDQILAGQRSPTVELRVPEGALLRWAARVERGELGADEQRVMREMGRPERIDVDPRAGASSWWYFARGKVYRFASGALVEVMDFEPVTPPE